MRPSIPPIPSLAAVETLPPDLPAAVVGDAVAKEFGIRGELSVLISERDQNFRLRAADGRCYVAKVVSAADTDVAVDFQIEVLERLTRQGFDGVPAPLPTIDGRRLGVVGEAGAPAYRLRLVSWVDGELLAAPSVAAAASLGHWLARLDRALEGIEHPGDRPVLPWDTQRLAELEPLVALIPDADLRRRADAVAEDFATRVEPSLAGLPAQVIHNDAHKGNVLYDPAGEVAGIIDFGDMLRAPRVIELATAAAYQRAPQPLKNIRPLAAAYQATNPLLPEETRLLYDLVRARLFLTIALLYWRVAERDASDPYRQELLTNETAAAEFLEALDTIGRERFQREVFS